MTMPTKCTEIQGEFPLYVGGDLESSTVQRVELHLEQCGSCRLALVRAHEAREALLDHFENGEQSRVRHSIWPKVREALRDEGLIVPADSTPSAPSRPSSTWGRVYRITGLAAAAALLFLLGTMAGRLAIESGSDPVPGAVGGPASEGDGPPMALVDAPAPESLQPVAGRALTPVLEGEQSMGKGAPAYRVESRESYLSPGLPVNWPRENQPATYTASDTRRRAGLR